MLTGDRKEAAQAVASITGVQEFHAALLPGDKTSIIEKLQHDGHKVAMVGDGVNDAPALTLANVGVAMGLRGSDAALQQADLVLARDRLEAFIDAWRLSRNAVRIMRYLSEAGSPARAITIARSLSINASTCFNILRTLALEEVVEFDPLSKTYTPGLGLTRLVENFLAEADALHS
jgi:P-type E1-E2 ATPase